METCQRTINLTNDFGKAGTRKCGKIATHKQGDGLLICTHHFNRTMKKLTKSGFHANAVPVKIEVAD